MIIKVKIHRFDPDRSPERSFSEYELDVEQGMTVLDGLIWLKENKDPTLSFRCACRMGVCGSCAMFINGYPHLACHTQILDVTKSTLTVEPLPNHPNVRDLVPDLGPFFENHRSVKPYIIRDEPDDMQAKAELVQTSDEYDAYVQFSYCIKCGICVSACPTCATDGEYTGPQAITQALRYSRDSRDGGAPGRMEAVEGEHGIFNCHYAGACSEACPKGVDPAFAIQLFKRHMVLTAWGLKGEKVQAGEMPPMKQDPKPDIPKAPEPTV